LEQRQAQLSQLVVKMGRANDQQRQKVYRAFTSDSFLRLALNYEPGIGYCSHSKVTIDVIDKENPHCYMLKLKNISQLGCVARQEKCNYKSNFIETPPEPLK